MQNNYNKSRFNATKHGILSKKALLTNEDPRFFAKFARRMMQELNPVGAVQFLLAERIVTTAWRLRRLLDVERAVMEYEKTEMEGDEWVFEKGIDHGQKYITRGMVINNYIEKILRYETTLERSLYKTIDKLKLIQREENGDNEISSIDVSSILKS